MTTAHTFDSLPAAQAFAAAGGQLIKLADVWVVVTEDGKAKPQRTFFQQITWSEKETATKWQS